MTILLTLITMIQTGVIVYLITRKPKEEVISPEMKAEIERRERIEKDWQELFNYNESIATRGYKE